MNNHAVINSLIKEIEELINQNVKVQIIQINNEKKLKEKLKSYKKLLNETTSASNF